MARKTIIKICSAIFLQLICCSELLKAAEAENVWEQFPESPQDYNDTLLNEIAKTITEKDKDYVLSVFQTIRNQKPDASPKQYKDTILPRLKNAAIFLYIRYQLCNNNAKEFARYLLLDDLNMMHRNIRLVVEGIRERFYNHVTNKHIFLYKQEPKTSHYALTTYVDKGNVPLAVYTPTTRNVNKTAILNNILNNLLETLGEEQFSFNDNCYEEGDKMILFQCGLPSKDGYQIDWRQEMPDLFNVKYAKLQGVINRNIDHTRPTGVHFELKLSDTNVTCGTLYPRVSPQTSKKPQ